MDASASKKRKTSSSAIPVVTYANDDIDGAIEKGDITFFRNYVSNSATNTRYAHEFVNMTALSIVLYSYRYMQSPEALEIIDILLEGGADLNAADSASGTPLFYACWWGVNVLKKMISYGGDIYTLDRDNWSCLHYAAYSTTDTSEVIKYLVSEGLDLNATESLEGDAPLHKAAYYGHVNNVKELLIAGANIFANNEYGHVALNSYEYKEEKWKLIGLNPNFRYCKYEENQHFNKHADGYYHESEEIQSFYTINIYLNNGNSIDFENGNTLFYDYNEKENNYILLANVIPTSGLGLIFNHHPHEYYHEGEKVKKGIKYLMRTDAMYETKKAIIIPKLKFKDFNGNLGELWKK